MTPIGIVSGSGIALDVLLDTVTRRVSFADVPGLVSGTVEGHQCVFVHGTCGLVPIVLQCGRLHLYEGLSYEAVVRTVDVLYEAGVRKILFATAAGGLLPQTTPGSLMAANQVMLRPFRGWPGIPATLSTDILPAGCDFTGPYCWVHGPCYETRAEIAMLQELGAAAVGMSVAPELMRCRELRIQAGIISCITNSCCEPIALTHAHIVAAAGNASHKLAHVIRKALPAIHDGQ